MLDFLAPKVTQKAKRGKNDNENESLVVYPEFLVRPSEDLMIKGQAFYAIWDEKAQMWSRDIGTARKLVDDALTEKRNQYPKDVPVSVMYLKNYSSKKWQEFLSYMKSLPDSFKDLDSQITFADTPVEKEDYVSRRLDYNLKSGSIDAYEELVSTLYDPIERQKIEWGIGAVISGESRNIEKMLVFYGQPGTGKGSMLKVIKQLFQSYCGVFTAQLLCGRSVDFALEMFKSNPLISIDFDGKLSNIEDNTTIDKVISHETLTINSKHKSLYDDSFETMLFVGTNNPVKITDSKSGIVRRLIDIHPSNNLIPFARYQVLKAQIKFELGAIAYHCLQVYTKLGADAYSGYIPIAMLGATNHIYNFIEEYYDRFDQEDGITLKEIWVLYQRYCEEAQVRYPYDMARVQDDMKGYFKEYYDRKHLSNGQFRRKLYFGFMKEKFNYGYLEKNNVPITPAVTIELNSSKSLIDTLFHDCKAQYDTGDPNYPLAQKWAKVETKLSMIDTRELHYVLPPKNHIVIDFDLKGPDGEKNLELNLEAASKWPGTYTELSKSGKGVHLHYTYGGDPSKLSTQYEDGIDILSFATGKALRRKLTKCNELPVSTLSSGLPEKKGASELISFEGLKNEKALRTLIKRNLKKEIQPGTKPSIDFIFKILTDYFASGKPYDVTDMRQAVLSFASNSSNHPLYCIKLVNKMPFKSETEETQDKWSTEELTFFDCEVYPNLFVICYKQEGYDVVKMINPNPAEVIELMKYRLVGFNNRKYDNHILYARMQGYSNEELYGLSKKIIGKSKNAMFRNAYSLSYTDVYDYCSAAEKKSLKKWQVELGIHHVEMSIPWDEPVPENLWMKVADYCANDVISTEAVFHATHGSWTARLILAELSGLTPNDTSNAHSSKIIFRGDKNPQSQFIYTDLSKQFPGYKFEFGVSTYRGEAVGEGGYVHAEPGMYENVPELDAESMHPSSIEALCLFGPVYTARYSEIKLARVYIKNGDYESAMTLMEGKLKKFLEGETDNAHLADALKTAINSVYGMTSAPFDNDFKDPRNIDNIVAKRGALFMIDLKHEVQDRGYTVAHIKTDSIKIPNADKEIISFVQEYGQKWGYKFKIEKNTPYQKFCLVNDAVYIALDADNKWSPKGKQFAVPYVFKTLFSKEEITTNDLIEVKHVTSPAAMVLDFDEALPIEEHDYQFVGKAGAFLPIVSGAGGGRLLRKKDDEYGAVTGTKDHRWMEYEMVVNLHKEESIDMTYYEGLAKDAKKVINEFGSFDEFVKPISVKEH